MLKFEPLNKNDLYLITSGTVNCHIEEPALSLSKGNRDIFNSLQGNYNYPFFCLKKYDPKTKKPK
ncbi:hypothetical protein C7S20_10925 [Christiangramia fulva]|uniref:Uncharacterized protein n=1 Tax=Christiangramia fulva TaxID=2126553 RepID=A0A2R3Z633_9FLAO|nr:hypothetical protein C7S20_10925 [Christiangramia fulva]